MLGIERSGPSRYAVGGQGRPQGTGHGVDDDGRTASDPDAVWPGMEGGTDRRIVGP